MPVPLLPPPPPALMPEPQADSDSQGEQLQQGSSKQQQQQQQKQQQKQRAEAAVAKLAPAEPAGAAAGGAPPEPPAANGHVEPVRAKGEEHEHDDNTAAALLLGMGSKSGSEDGGDSAGSSGRNAAAPGADAALGVAAAARRRQAERGAAANGAAAAHGEDEDEEEEEEEEEEEARGARGKGRGGAAVRRSARRGRTPAYRASDLLGSGSDDEFEPGSKRAGKASGAAARAASAAAPQKSELTLLCERFQLQFGHLKADGTANTLMLNDVAEALGVPRRRLYDVINVFESIEVMRRVGKLMYEWVGFDHLPGLLRQLADDEAKGLPVEDRIRRAPTLIIVNEQGEEVGSGKGNSHSLWVLSRRLVRMLLKQQGPIALTAAAAVLVGPGGVSDPSKHRSQTQITVERRLYDIGSILCSVGLLERIYMKKRQPAFEWIYGWRPGDAHDPPKLPNRVAAPDDEGTGRAGRKRAAKAPAAPPAGGDAKRPRAPGEAAPGEAPAVGAGGMPLGAMPFGMAMPGFGHAMMMPPHGMVGGPPGAAPTMVPFMAPGMPGMPGMPGAADDKAAAAAAMQMAPFFAPHGAFFANPMMQMGGMGMAMPAAAAAATEPSPAAPEGAGAPGSADDGAGAGVPPGMPGGPPGVVMWHPQVAMMNPAMMQQYQMQQAAMLKSGEAALAAQAAAGGPPKPGAPPGMGGPASPFPGMMMPGMMMAPYPLMQPLQNFVPVGAGAGGAAAPQ